MRNPILSLCLSGPLIAGPLGGVAQQPAAKPSGSCVVDRVADGDSFHCRDGRRVRLIGIDSPESHQQPFGAAARGALLKLMPTGTTVWLEPDVAPADRYGRLLAYVWVGPTLVNEAMVQDGWAVLYTVPPNVKYAERLQRAQNEARARSTGLWAQRGFDCLPSDFRRKRCLSRP
jgi:micrococcal nuclease